MLIKQFMIIAQVCLGLVILEGMHVMPRQAESLWLSQLSGESDGLLQITETAGIQALKCEHASCFVSSYILH